jgi:uncharacterized protein
MSKLASLFEPGWSISYETLFKGTSFIRAWATYEGLAPDDRLTPWAPGAEVHRFDFWQELNYGALGRRGRRRLKASLRCTDDYRPLSYDIWLSGLNAHIDFTGHSFRARLTDGSTVEGSCDGADFLLASNLLPQLAVKIRLLAADGPPAYQGAFFSPDSLQVIPYSLTPADSVLRSSLEESMRIDAEGWLTEVALPEKEFTIRRMGPALPRWRNRPPGPTTTPKGHTYAPPGEHVARVVEVEIPGPDVTIGGTLALPAPGVIARAAALFLAGSGRHDRHGFAYGLDLGYHELLDALAMSGIISLRFDKRGAGSTKLGAVVSELSFEQVLADAEAALAYLLSRMESANLSLFLIGHSQGGLVALELAAGRPDIAGVVLLATAGRPLDEVIEEQLVTQAKEIELSEESLAAKVSDLRNFFHYVRHVADWTPESVPPKVYAARGTRKWFKGLLEHDPVRLISRLRCPVLIAQCNRDTQVSVRDAELLFSAARATNSEVERIILRGCDHLFKRVGKKAALRMDYSRRRHVLPELLTAVRDWVFRVLKDV